MTNTQQPRTMTQLVQAMRDASRPDQESTLTLQPGDHKAIAALGFMVDWIQQNGACEASYRTYARDRMSGKAARGPS